MSIDALLATTAVDRDPYRRRAGINKAAKTPHRVVVTLMPTAAALSDHHWCLHVLEMLLAASMGVIGRGPSRQCAACARAWSNRRVPVEIALIEILGANNNMIAGICASCMRAGNPWKRLCAALERDLGIDISTRRVVGQGGRA